jgi:hypothetical protein
MYHEDFTHLPPTFAVGQQFSPGTVGNQLLYIFGKTKRGNIPIRLTVTLHKPQVLDKKKKKKVGELTWHIVFFWKKRENISMSLTVLYMGQKYWSKQGQNSKKIVTDLFALT